MKRFKQTLKLLGIFLAVNIVLGTMVIIAWIVYYKSMNPGVGLRTAFDSMPSLYSMLLSDALLAVTILFAWKSKLIRLPQCMMFSKEQWSKAALPLALGVSWFVCEMFISDFINIQADEKTANVLADCSHSVIGVLSICIVGPVMEELIMREGFLGTMLRNKVNPWVAIVASALAFGAFHFNMWQFVPATIGGIVLGVLYWKTGNIVLPAIIHIINNTTATVVNFVTGDVSDEVMMYDLLGGKTVGIILCCVFAVTSAVLLIRYLKTEEATPEYNQ